MRILEFNNVWNFTFLTEDCRSGAVLTLLSFINCDVCAIHEMSAAPEGWYGQRFRNKRNATCAVSFSV
jgi:hypothetical protein